jgi:hypothetical protein
LIKKRTEIKKKLKMGAKGSVEAAKMNAESWGQIEVHTITINSIQSTKNSIKNPSLEI